MKCLLVVMFASACAGPIQVQPPPVAQPRGTHVFDQRDRCNLSWLEKAIDYNATCGVIYRR